MPVPVQCQCQGQWQVPTHNVNKSLLLKLNHPVDDLAMELGAPATLSTIATVGETQQLESVKQSRSVCPLSSPVQVQCKIKIWINKQIKQQTKFKHGQTSPLLGLPFSRTYTQFSKVQVHVRP